jgi:replicative DNA helicase
MSVFSLDAEMGLIGMVLVDRDLCAEALERVRPDQFSESLYGAIWESVRAGGSSNVTLIAEQFGAHPGMRNRPASHIVDLLFNAPSVAQASEFADAVIDAHARRCITNLCEAARSECRHAGSGSAVLGDLERGLAQIARDAALGPSAVPAGLTALENLEGALQGKFRGVETGLWCIDRITGGIKRDDVWVIGGRSSMGKSVAALSLARGVAQTNRAVLVWSLEMGLREVQARLIADLVHDFFGGVRVRYSDILKGSLYHDALTHARRGAKMLAELPLSVCDEGGLTIEDIRSRSLRQVRAWERQGIEPGLIVIDHLGLIKPLRPTSNKAADTADVVNELKSIAKQVGCPILALAQVNRGPEQRADKHPTMADLNWSGSIEQIADFVCLLYRQAYYDERSSDPEQIAKAEEHKFEIDLSIQKNRAGPTCTVKAWIDIASNALRDRPGEERRATAPY